MENAASTHSAITWRTFYKALRAEISAGKPAPGEQLESIARLSAFYGCKPHTVRRALQQLQEDGLVTSWQGKGTFVTEPRFDYCIRDRTRFSSNAQSYQGSSGTELLTLGLRFPQKHIERGLGLRTRTKVLEAEMLRILDGKPVTVALHYFDPHVFPRLQDHLAEYRSVTRAMAASGLNDYFRSRTEIEVRLPTARERLLLDVPPSQPVLITFATNVDGNGRIIEVSVGTSRGDRIRLIV